MNYKILQFTYDLGGGGLEAFVTNLNNCREVFEKPFDFIVYREESYKEFYEDRNKKMGSVIYKVAEGCSEKFLFRCIQERVNAYKVMKKNAYDVVHIHSSNAFCVIEVLLAKAAGTKKIIVHSHNTKMNESGIKAKIKYVVHIICKTLICHNANELLGCSTEACEWMFGRRAVAEKRTVVVKNGIVGSEYYYNATTRNEFRNRLGWKDNIIIGNVGRMTQQKNHTFLLDIFAKIYEINKNARLLLLGDGELRNVLQNKVEKLGLKDVVLFYGLSDEISKWLQAMDLFIMPSLYEGLPVAGIEAQAAGVPLLAANTISPEMKVTDTVKWMSLDVNPTEWAKKALDMAMIQHTNNKKAIIEAGYDISYTAQELIKLYIK